MGEPNAVGHRGHKQSLARWLFNPFQFVAGATALCAGLGVMLATALLASATGVHFDGVLDCHFGGTGAPLWLHLGEVIVDWVCMGVILTVCGLLFSRSSFRIVDVFGTQALARAPYLVVAAVSLLAPARNAVGELAAAMQTGDGLSGIDTGDALLAGVTLLLCVLMGIWMVALMYRAYSVSCNLKGPKAIGSFIAALIAAEIVSKAAWWQLYRATG